MAFTRNTSKHVLICLAVICLFTALTGHAYAETRVPSPGERYSAAIFFSESAAKFAIPAEPFQQQSVLGDLSKYDCAAYQYIPLSSWDLGYIDKTSGQVILTNTKDQSEITPRLDRGCTRLAYASNREGNYEIYIMQLGDRSIKRIKGAGNNVRPYWSPDGTQIVFESDRDSQAEIYAMNADGSNVRRLTNDPGRDGMPVYSPGGTHILFASNRTGVYRIYRMGVDGSSPVPVGSVPDSLLPVYSPDGARIGFSADSDGDGWLELWAMKADGSEAKMLVNPGTGYDLVASAWSANGYFLDYTQVRWLQYQGQWYWDLTMLYSYDFVNNHPTNWPLQFFYGTEWYIDRQTSDTTPPTSSLDPLPEMCSVAIPVTWSGYDVPADNFRGFDVQVKDGSLGWTDWLTNTQLTGTAYQGLGGHTYAFRVRARDYSSNVEAWPAQAEAVTYLENRPPEITMVRFPGDAPGAFTAVWYAEEPYGGSVQSYDLQYRQSSSGVWLDWLDTLLGEVFFEGAPGFTYDFRIRATDTGLSTSPWPAVPHGSVTLYAAKLYGGVYDHTGAPLGDVAVNTGSAQPAPFKFVSKAGSYKAYFSAVNSSQPFLLTKSGYDQLPLTAFQGAIERKLDFWLPPGDNAVQDWGFESGSLDGSWALSGAITPSLALNPAHTGLYSARLGEPAITGLELPALITERSSGDTAPVVIADFSGRVHAFINHNNQLQYSVRARSGAWSVPVTMQANTFWSPHPSVAIDKTGVLHLLYMRQDEFKAEIFYQTLPPGGSWSAPEQISFTPDSSLSPLLAIDSRGYLHVVWRDLSLSGGGASIVYTNRSPAGVWSPPYFLGGQNDPVALLVGNDDHAHILWDWSGSSLSYARFNTQGAGNPEDSRTLLYGYYVQGDYYSPPFWLDHMGLPHIAWSGSTADGIPSLCTKRLTEQEQWTEAECLQVGGGEAGRVRVALNSNGDEQFIWDDMPSPGNWRLRFAVRHPDGSWENAQTVHEQACYGCASMGLVSGENQTLYAWWTDSSSLYFSMKPSGGGWTPPAAVAPSSSTYEYVRKVPGYSGDLGVLFANQSQLYWIGQPPSNKTGESRLSQAVFVPAGMSHPALSFSYRLEGAYPGIDAGLEVAVQDGLRTTQVMTLTANSTVWQRASVDASAWAGQSITVTLATQQAASAPRLRAYIDEVALGSVYPDLRLDFVEMGEVLRPGDTITLTLLVRNQGHAPGSGVLLSVAPPAGLDFVSASLPPSSVSAQITFDLGDFSPSSAVSSLDLVFEVDPAQPGGELAISADLSGPQELEDGNNTASLALVVGATRYIYLPRLMR